MTAEVNGAGPVSDLEDVLERFSEAFNSGNVEAVNALYSEEAVAVWDPGIPLSGRARLDRATEFMSYGPAIEATVRQSLVAGDTAMVIVDWSMQTTGADGKPEHLKGVAVDILRRDNDGNWRYLIDYPYAAQ
ncbi:nuclear transport factor 2 family protein [Kitasatospora sp. GAS204B]|uniref:YybH family protein n=1 Tax=unclassified Kitasatospora TaxID=2633591 RepID=UPI0024765A3B|nr:nuclear transport factor 2 family protein [Kitasatospora sp. GAS204B]MDH6122866.1 uncharacterized protein (TIGR02246 family) [Kitasatospora sp. GAS204B]